jgi:hypothetical protein
MDLVNHFRAEAGLEEVGQVNRLDRVEEKVSVQPHLAAEQALVLGLIMGNKSLGLAGLHRELWQMGYTVPMDVVRELVGQLAKLGKLVLKETVPAPAQRAAVAVQEVTEPVQTEAATPVTKPLPQRSEVVIPEELMGVVAAWKDGATSIRKMGVALGCGKSKAAELLSRARGMGLLAGSVTAGYAA